ncbi:MAG TPA: hypothetical protein VHU23_09270 [Rhizomicrobium sp.]|nr:hypothetical protein [Rhizomicrobium sp.]
MLPRCWLHIGVEKTGTTSIQNFLAANRSALRARGVLYPLTPGAVSHLGLVAYALDDARVDGTRKVRRLFDPAQIASFRGRFTRALDEEISTSGASEIILSSELLSSRLRSPSEIARLKSLCDRIARRTNVVVYLRNQVDFLVSRYTTIIQLGGREEFGVRGIAFGDYARLLDRWATTFGRGNLIVRRFEPQDFVDGDLLADFAAATDLGFKNLVAVPRHNESLDAESLAFLRAINRGFPQKIAERVGSLRSAAVAVLQRRQGGTKFLIPPKLAGRIGTHFRASNEYVSRQYFESRYQPLFAPAKLVARNGDTPPGPLHCYEALHLSGVVALGLIKQAFRRFGR